MKLIRLQIPTRLVRWFSIDDWHYSILEGFSEKTGKKEFLFRVDNYGLQTELFIRCPNHPDYSFSLQKFAEKARISQKQNIRQEEKIIPKSFWNYKYYHFKLRAEPVVTRSPKKDKSKDAIQKEGKSKRYYIVNEKDAIAWLKRKIASWGNLENCEIEIFKKEQFVPEREKGKIHRKYLRRQTDFYGVISVNDHEKLIQDCQKGIGPGHNYGSGLLLLKPIK